MKLGRKSGLQGEEGPSGLDPGRETTGRRGGSGSTRRGSKRGYLDGQMLIAMPTMGDERFARSLIYVCAHSSEGAMGIIVNQPAAHISFPELLVQLDVAGASDLMLLPARAGAVQLHNVGTV